MKAPAYFPKILEGTSVTKPANVQALHKPVLDFQSADLADRITSEDIRKLGGPALYAVVIKHWHKCDRCAQVALLQNNCKAVSDAAKFMANLHDNGMTAVA